MNRELIEHLYRTMVRMRAFEETVSKWFYRGQIPGFAHLYIGQEAVATGVCAALKPSDYITSTHRGHGHVLAKGADTKAMMAEIFGRQTGLCKGKGGSMHLADMNLGILGANGILAAGAALATGAALGAKMGGGNWVGVSFFGDAAASQGVVWEAMNLASVWKLPAIFVVENNGYGEWTPTHELTSTLRFSERGAGWSMPGVLVDGNDVLAVYDAALAAVERARAGQGPTLLECITYRWRGHNEGEEAFIGKWSYRKKEELEEWMQRDPIARLRALCLEKNFPSSNDLEQIDAEAAKEMEEAVSYAQQSPFPQPEEALIGLYKD